MSVDRSDPQPPEDPRRAVRDIASPTDVIAEIKARDADAAGKDELSGDDAAYAIADRATLLAYQEAASDAIRVLRDENAKLRELTTWRSIDSAPKTPKDSTRAVELLGWCPDETSPIGGDRRTIWWEPRLNGGCWYSDRDMVEHPTKWTTLPDPPP